MRVFKYLLTVAICTLFVHNSFSQEINSLEDAIEVLSKTEKITSSKAGEMMEEPAEILAFNFIYTSKNPNLAYKELFAQSKSAGKFYALIGLYLLKDNEFELLKEKFTSSSQEKVMVQYGCKVSDGMEIKGILESWLKGIPEGLWYTDIIIEKKPIIE
jgi:hypothetical protein